MTNTWRAPTRKRIKLSTLNFAHVSKRLLHKTVPAFFLIMCYSFFIATIWRALKAYLAWKQLKVDHSKNIWKKKSRAQFCSCLGWLNISEKIIELNNSVSAGANKEGKVVFGPTLTLICLIFGKSAKGKFHILKKVDLNTLKEIL